VKRIIVENLVTFFS